MIFRVVNFYCFEAKQEIIGLQKLKINIVIRNCWTLLIWDKPTFQMKGNPIAKTENQISEKSLCWLLQGVSKIDKVGNTDDFAPFE